MTNVIFKTSQTGNIGNLINDDTITANPLVPIEPGVIYFTSDGHIIYDLEKYKATEDTAIINNKQYYQLINGTYELVNTPTVENLNSYFEANHQRVWMSRDTLNAINAQNDENGDNIATTYVKIDDFDNQLTWEVW